MIARRLGLIGALVWASSAVLWAGACGTAGEVRDVATLRPLSYRLLGFRGATLAGVSLAELSAYETLAVTDLQRIAEAVSADEAAFRGLLVIAIENPAANRAELRLMEMPWRLEAFDRDLDEGRFAEPVVLPPAAVTEVVLPVAFEMTALFPGSVRETINRAFLIVGEEEGPDLIRLHAEPVLRTSLGTLATRSALVITADD